MLSAIEPQDFELMNASLFGLNETDSATKLLSECYPAHATSGTLSAATGVIANTVTLPYTGGVLFEIDAVAISSKPVPLSSEAVAAPRKTRRRWDDRAGVIRFPSETV